MEDQGNLAGGHDGDTSQKGGEDTSAAKGQGRDESQGGEGGLAGQKGQKSGGSSWYQTFAEGLDEDTKGAWDKYASRYQSQAEFAKATVEMRKTYDQRVPLPQSPAEMAEFYQKHGQALGIPKDPAEYEYEMPEGVNFDETEMGQIEEYRKVAHRTGRSKDGFKEDMKFLAESRKVQNDAIAARAKKLTAKNHEALKREWQFDYETNVEVYKTAVNEFAKEDRDEFLTLRLEDGTLAQNHPVIAKMLVRAGRDRMEDDRDLNDFNRGARMGAQAEIDELEARLAKEYGPTWRWPKEEHAKLERLYGRLHGARPKSPHEL